MSENEMGIIGIQGDCCQKREREKKTKPENESLFSLSVQARETSKAKVGKSLISWDEITAS
jgi:hypothetical protein